MSTDNEVMRGSIARFLGTNAGVASVSEVSILVDETEGRVRAWARANPGRVRRLGSTFAFTTDAIDAMLAEFESAPTFREAAAAAELALSRLRDAVEWQGDPKIATAARPLFNTLRTVEQELRSMSLAWDDNEEEATDV